MEQDASRAAQRGRHRLATVLAGLLLLTGSVTGGQEDLSTAARRLESAFEARSSRVLRAILPSRGKIRVDLPSLAPDATGLLSASQFGYLLDDLFRRHPVARLTLEDVPRSPQPSGAVVFAGLELKTDAGKRTALSLHIVFADEEAGWTLREFRERARPAP
jgi:hypothetical protein